MSFFEDAVSAAKTVGKTVSKRTEEILIISKKKLEAIELENKLSNLFEELGKLYFSLLNTNSERGDDDFRGQNDITDEIHKTTCALKELRNEIESLSKSK